MRLNNRILLISMLLVFTTFIQAESKLHIGYVYPAGGKRASKFQITIGGQELDSVTSVYVSGNGVRTAFLQYEVPEWVGKKGRKAVQVKDSTVKKNKARNPKRQQNSQIDEMVIAEIEIDSTATEGDREIRVVTSNGVSNPLKFCISNYQEVTETEPNDKRAQAQELPPSPFVVNGQIVAGDEDWFKLFIKKGDQLNFKAQTRALIPYLADAVPGWFQAALTLSDSTGAEVAYADHYRFEPDPVLNFKANKTGWYYLQVRDMLFRGREDFVYRITVDKKGIPATAYKKVISKDYDFTQLKETEPNNNFKAAQKIKTPVLINGLIQKPGDIDTYSFTGTKGEQISAEVIARRNGSYLDSFLKLTDSTGKMLITNDDFTDKGEGLSTHQADSYFTYKLPATGVYYLQIGDIQNNGGDDNNYVLRVSHPVPNFELIVEPSEIVIPQGGTAIVTVYIIKKDGFGSDIMLSLKDTTSGIKINGSLIPTDKDQFRFTISVPENMQQGITRLNLLGTAAVANRRIINDAIPADEMMQAFSYKHYVHAQELALLVTQKQEAEIDPVLASNEVLKIPAGGSVELNMDILRDEDFKGKLTVSLDNPPKGITANDIQTLEKDRKKTITIKADGKELKVGYKGNIILHGTVNKKKVICTVPAIPFVITANTNNVKK